MFLLKRSPIDPNYLAVFQGNELVKEIFAPFKVGKIPPFFETVEGLDKWLETTEKSLARGAALFFLARRSLSSQILYKKLVQKKFSTKVIEVTIESLKKIGYLSDEEYYERQIFNEFQKGKGPRYIAMKLGLDLGKVREAISLEMEEKEIEKIFKKKGGLPRRKIAQSLLRKGFDPEIVFKQIR